MVIMMAMVIVGFIESIKLLSIVHHQMIPPDQQDGCGDDSNGDSDSDGDHHLHGHQPMIPPEHQHGYMEIMVIMIGLIDYLSICSMRTMSSCSAPKASSFSIATLPSLGQSGQWSTFWQFFLGRVLQFQHSSKGSVFF